MVEDSEHMRKAFYHNLTSGTNTLPDGWSFNKETVYSDKPSLRKEIGTDIVLILSLRIHSSTITIISSVQEENPNSFDYNLGYRWKFEGPAEAAKGVLDDAIPKMEENYEELL